MLYLLAQTVAPDPLSGSAGWLGAGLLGAVLSWLLLVHLPGQLKIAQALFNQNVMERADAEKRFSDERSIEREARHERSGEFHETMAKMAVTFQTSLKAIEDQHKQDAKDDRQAFLDRNVRLEDALKLQTLELKSALSGMVQSICRFTGECENFKPKKPQ